MASRTGDPAQSVAAQDAEWQEYADGTGDTGLDGAGAASANDTQYEYGSYRSPEPRNKLGRSRVGPALVDELAGPEDYWLTLTDAARVTRRQEVTIRRWVAAGSLPVRSRPLGLNKRSRHVRASDLSALTPIVDASATISGAAAQIDLLSIPERQASILGHQHEIEESVRDLSSQIVGATSSQQTLIEEQSRQLSQVEHTIERLQVAVATHVQEVDQQQTKTASHVTILQQEVRHAANQMKQWHGELQALRVHLEGYAGRQMAQQEIQLQQGARLEGLEHLFERIHKIEERQTEEDKDRSEQRQQVEDLANRVGSLDESLRQYVETLTSDIIARDAAHQVAERQINEVRTSVTRLRKEMHQGISVATKTATGLKQQLHDLQEAVRATSTYAQEVAENVAEQDERLAQLNQQVVLLSSMTHDLKQQGDQGSQTVRPRRGGSRSGRL